MAAAVAGLLLMSGARYGLKVLTERAEADAEFRETGVIDVTAAEARADGQIISQTQQLYESLLTDLGDPVSPARDTFQPVLIKRVEPKYPAAARKAGVEGLVIVTYAIDPHGRPKDLKVTKSIPMLDDAVLTALRQWEYTPPPLGSTAAIYRCNAEFVLEGLTTLASSAPLP